MTTDMLTDSLTDLEILEGLDWEFMPPCEHSEHDKKHRPDDPARYLIAYSPCAHCGHTLEYLICESGWKWLMGLGEAYCISCFRLFEVAGNYTIIQDLKA